jgi:hypothetical protein
MRKLSAVASVIFFTAILFVAGGDAFAGRDPEGWTSLREDLLISRNSITYTSGDTIRLWVRIVPDKESAFYAETEKQLREKSGKLAVYAYEYTGFLSEIDCSEKRHRNLMTIHYDSNRNIMQWIDHSSAPWDKISPESRFHLVEAAVCSQDRDIAASLR